MQFVKEAKSWYKLWSVQLMTIVLALEVLNQTWAQYSDVIPEPYHGYAQSVLTVVAVFARLIRQKSLTQHVR